MFSKVNSDLGKRIETSTEALIKQNETVTVTKDLNNIKISKQNGVKNGIVNGNSHNSGMFAHKNWN